MSRHMYFHREIDDLKKTILKLGTLVEDRLRRACAILETRNEDQAQALITADWEIDDMEIRVEEECLKILALHQPVARDLRLIVMIIKINNELERIADIAVNIAKRMVTINKCRTPGSVFTPRLSAHGRQGPGDGQGQPGCPGDRGCGPGPPDFPHG